MIGAGVFVLLTFLLAMSFSRWQPWSRMNPPDGTGTSAKPPSVEDPEADPGKEWADALAEFRDSATTKAEVQVAAVLASRDEGRRIRGIDTLAVRLPSWLESESRRDPLSDLLATLHAQDPTPSVAAEIRALWARSIDPPKTENDSPDPTRYAVGFWGLETAFRAIRRPDLDPDRRSALAKIVEKTGVGKGWNDLEALDDAEADAILEGSLRRLAEGFYRDLIADARAEAGFGGFETARSALSQESAKVLPADRLAALNAEFFVEAVQADASDPRNYRPLLDELLATGRPEAIDPILGLASRSNDSVVRDMIGGALRKRIGPNAPADPDELAAEFRKAARPGVDRLEGFQGIAQAALDAKPTDDPIAMLAAAVELARASTLAVALVREDTGAYDKILSPPDDPNSRPGQMGQMSIRKPTFGGLISEADDLIREIDRGDPSRRVRAWLQLASAEIPADLGPDRARILARYVLWGGKDRQEAAVATNGLREVGAPRSVRLGLADALAHGFGLPPRFHLISAESLQVVLSAILGRNIEFHDRDSRSEAARLLLESVLDDLGSDPDALASTYRDYYRAQARLLGLDEAETTMTGRPSQIVEALVNSVLSDLRSQAAAFSDTGRARLDRLPHEVIAADYSATDELSRTVLMQEIWVRVLALKIALDHPDLADRAEGSVDRLDREVADGRLDPARQLWLGERTALELWRLPMANSSGGR